MRIPIFTGLAALCVAFIAGGFSAMWLQTRRLSADREREAWDIVFVDSDAADQSGLLDRDAKVRTAFLHVPVLEEMSAVCLTASGDITLEEFADVLDAIRRETVTPVLALERAQQDGAFFVATGETPAGPGHYFTVEPTDSGMEISRRGEWIDGF